MQYFWTDAGANWGLILAGTLGFIVAGWLFVDWVLGAEDRRRARYFEARSSREARRAVRQQDFESQQLDQSEDGRS